MTIDQPSRGSWRRVRLGRRTFLRGAGAMVAFPLLEEMLPSRARAQDQSPAARVITATLGGGVAAEWQQGSYFTGPLSPLAPFRDKLGFYRGLTGRSNHGPANALLMTGCTWTKDVPRANAATIDWTLMNHFYPNGFPGRIPFLNVGIRNRSAENLLQHARVWDDGPNPLGTPTYTPNDVFRSIFGRLPTQSAEEVASETAADASILDAVVDQYRYYASDAAGLSMASRRRLSDHLDQIRSLEVAMGGLELMGCEAPELPADTVLTSIEDGVPRGPERSHVSHYIRQFNVIADLFVLAMRCDLSRFGHVLIFPLAAHGHFSDRYRSFDGSVVDFDRLRQSAADLNRHGDWHNTNHALPRHSGEARGRALELAGAYRQVGLDMLHRLLAGLDAPESIEANGRTILENALFFAVSELGTNHQGDSIFHALGPARGTFRTGLIDVPEGATTRQFYETVLAAYGAPPVDPAYAFGPGGTVHGVTR